MPATRTTGRPAGPGARLGDPFSGRVPPDKLFDVERGGRQLLARCREVTPETTGGFVAWDGSPIPW